MTLIDLVHIIQILLVMESRAIDNVAINNVSENDVSMRNIVLWYFYSNSVLFYRLVPTIRSPPEWLTQDGYTISIDFRKFQTESIKKSDFIICERNWYDIVSAKLQNLGYNIQLCLYLQSIMYCNELMLNVPKRHGMKLVQDH